MARSWGRQLVICKLWCSHGWDIQGSHWILAKAWDICGGGGPHGWNLLCGNFILQSGVLLQSGTLRRLASSWNWSAAVLQTGFRQLLMKTTDSCLHDWGSERSSSVCERSSFSLCVLQIDFGCKIYSLSLGDTQWVCFLETTARKEILSSNFSFQCC